MNESLQELSDAELRKILKIRNLALGRAKNLLRLATQGLASREQEMRQVQIELHRRKVSGAYDVDDVDLAESERRNARRRARAAELAAQGIKRTRTTERGMSQ